MADTRARWLALFVLGTVVHGLWAWSEPFPHDLDAQYYLAVARRLAAGDGATTASLWNLTWLPPQIPLLADVHWMPLPSRALVPGLWIAPGWGDRLISVLLAACWGPLTWRFAARVAPDVAWGAALLATTGGVYARYLSAPDCYALYGVLGAVGLIAAAEQRTAWGAVAALLASLTRNDGVLLGASLAPGWTSWGARLLVAGAGVAGAAAWTARNLLAVGPEWLTQRQAITATTDYLALFDGVPRAAISFSGRLVALIDALPDLVTFWATPGLGVLTVPAAWAAWRRRREGWVQGYLLFFLAVPVVAVVAAPAIALHGTLYRSGAAMMAAHLVLAAEGLAALAASAQAARGYPRPFTVGVLAGAYVFIATALGVQKAREPERPSECALVADLPPGEPVFTSRPLEMELRCGRPGVMLTRTLTPERAAEVAERYGVRVAVVSPDHRRDEGSALGPDIERILGWEPVGEDIYAAVGR